MPHVAPLILFCVSSCLTPGPNNLMLMTSGLHVGFKKSLPHFFGILFGFPLMIFLIGLGLGKIFTAYPLCQQVLKIGGALYMTYLAWKITRPVKNSTLPDQPLSFFQAARFQWVNPKAWTIGIAAIALFSHNNNIAYYQQMFIIAIIYGIVCFFCTGIWLVFGTFLQRIIRSAKQQQIFNFLMAFLLIASILTIFLE